MTATHFRALVAGWMITYIWSFSMPYYKQTQDVRDAMEYAGRGGVIAPSDGLAYTFLAVAMASALGLLALRPWARRLFLAYIATSLAMNPFFGVLVSAPFDGFLATVMTLLEGAVITAAYASSVSACFVSATPPPETQTEDDQVPAPLNDEELLEVFETNNPAEIPAVKARLANANIDFMTTNEPVEALIGAGQLGGLNPAVGPVCFLVRASDAQRARSVLETLVEEVEK